ncbi:FAD-dependent oxidoreductase [Desulfovibrio ferrophilus]|uniref:Glutamate synthase (NADPH) small subunit n=1 Tax=Desulfovibrio ferrophilus TaxID=241368 RepID=A0A2Z6AU48_9BACT|nr:FAD-dependent oxidoreductase [Desulfovibrio ferrophilus]BBD06751.1 glutamate synthase (NADPH) small subunit [Desulfovibrio ferrophilus]
MPNKMNFGLFKDKPGQPNGRTVAVAGAGPSGLVAAGYLACQGYHVEVFDKMPKAGGLLYFGIPDFRLPVHRTEAAAKLLEEQYGVVFNLRTKIVGDPGEPHDEGDDFEHEAVHLDELRKRFDAVLLCTGSWRSRRMGIPGEDLAGVLSGLEYLFPLRGATCSGEVCISKASAKNVVVIGAGLSAVDAADCALRNGARKVTMLYRRTVNEAPSGPYEISLLQDRGMVWKELAVPVKILGEKMVEGVEYLQCTLGEPDESGRRCPLPQDGSNKELKADMVISAVGELPTLPQADKLDLWKVRKGATSWPRMSLVDGVFLAGDALTGPSKIGWAITGGLEAAKSIEEWLDYTQRG